MDFNPGRTDWSGATTHTSDSNQSAPHPSLGTTLSGSTLSGSTPAANPAKNLPSASESPPK
jgi:hypothetical protein